MCWTSRKEPVKQIATENITVYKYTRLKTRRRFPQFWKKKLVAAISDIYNYRYLPYISNKVLSLIPRLHPARTCWIIEEGYHSVLRPDQTTNKLLERYPNIKFIIPKGATYYVNEFNEVVSSEIIMTDELI